VTVILLGASGFLGSWTARALVAEGVDVVALVRPSTDVWRIEPIPAVRVVRSEPDDWATVIPGLRPEVLVSCEWQGVAGAHRDDPLQWANLDRLERVLDAAGNAGVRRFVGVGSQAEYGPVGGRISERHEAAPVTEYGKAKLAAMVRSSRMTRVRGMEWTWARVFSTFGPLDNDSWLLPTIADALLAGRRIPLSPGKQHWSYLPGWDAGRALSRLAITPNASGIYNVGHPNAPRLRDVIEQFARPFDRSDLLGFGDIELGAAAVRHLEPDTARLESLGWRADSDLSEALAESAAWFSGESTLDRILGGMLPTRPR
jgi:nucleoside-diphosphate-sugar epimerase